MFIVINRSFGGFSVPADVCAELNCPRYPMDEEEIAVRTSDAFIAWVNANADRTSLEVVEIPADATDWEIDEYDGKESITAVVNGKLMHIA